MHQGDLYWLRFDGDGSEPSGRRPAVVVQHDRYNLSTIRTTVVAAVTSNLRLGAKPGNVRLARGEANLSKPSVVNVTQLVTVDRGRLGDRIGTLRPQRLHEVLRGLGLVLGIETVAADDE
jgi:mRNA interferase MazF